MSEIYNIPLSSSFLNEVALFVADIHKKGSNLSEYTIFLPNKRSRTVLKTKITEFFHETAFFLPQIKVISDEFLLDDMKIVFLITNLLKKKVPNVPLNTVYTLSESMFSLLKSITLYEIDYQMLGHIVPGHFMEYWEHTISIINECMRCDEIKKSLNFVKNKFDIFIEDIITSNAKIIAAGIGNTNVCTKKFLQAVQKSRNGTILLIGNDIKSSQNHAYNQKLSINLEKIQTHNRIAEHPVSTCSIEFAEFPSTSTEAFAVAVRVRNALYEHKSVMVVTADTKLATKIKYELLRWNIIADDSSGEKFSNTQSGILISQVIDAINSRFQTSKTLNVLKLNPIHINRLQELELFLRKQERVPLMFFEAFAFWQKYLHKDNVMLINNNDKAFDNFINEFRKKAVYNDESRKSFSEWTTLINDIAGIISPNDATAFNKNISAFLKYSELLGDISFEEYRIFIKNHVLTTFAQHPFGYTKNVIILGFLEAQLIDADVIIVAGANENCISSHEDSDFWLSKSMMKSLGIQTADAKNEFLQCIFERLLFKHNTLITRSKKIDGIQQQIYTYIDKLPKDKICNKTIELTEFINCSYKLHRGHRFEFIPPKPDLLYRPNKFSVTDIDTLRNNPYSFYAKKILRLKELNDIYGSKNIRGNYIHKIMEVFFREPKEKRNLDNLKIIAENILKNIWLEKTDLGIWFFKLDNIFSFIIKNLNNDITSLPEKRGEYVINITKDYSCAISCIADRIDLLDNNRISIIDYKTGEPPTKEQMEYGLKPQLPIEALIALNDGFNIGKKNVASLLFLFLKGDKNGGEIHHMYTDEESINDLSEKTLAGLKNLINKYNILGIAYNVNPNYKYDEKYSHLARIKEWYDV